MRSHHFLQPNLMQHNNSSLGDSEELEAQLAFVERNYERQANYTRRKPLLTFVQCANLIGLIGLAFGVVYFSRTSDSGPANYVPLADPPSNLDKICHEKKMIEGTIHECREACEEAECCDFPANLALSCLAGNEHKCMAYHEYCHILKGHYDLNGELPEAVPPAPLNLGNICAAENIATVDGFGECQEACSRAECCYDKSTAKCSFSECSGYAPCLVLTATDKVHPEIPIEVNRKCKASSLVSIPGRKACRDVCSHALCCFTREGCPHESEEFCQQYERCDTLEKDLEVEASATEIKENCEHVPLHESMCEVSCERGQCCFMEEGCGDLFPGLDCKKYEPCTKLFHGSIDDFPTKVNTPQNTNPTPPPQTTVRVGAVAIYEACIEDELPPPQDGEATLCQMLCHPGQCCYDVNKCHDPVPRGFTCNDYAPCHVIYGDGGFLGDRTDPKKPSKSETEISVSELESAADIIFEACEDDEFPPQADGQPTLCQKLCREGRCCFESQKCSEAVPRGHMCNDYASCHILYGTTGFKGMIEDTEMYTESKNGDPQAAVSIHPGAIAMYEACEDDGIPPPKLGQLTLCEKLCTKGRCCYDVNDCQEPPPDGMTCGDYSSCHVLYGTDTSKGTSEEPKETADTETKEEPQAASRHYDATTVYEACEGDEIPPPKDGELTLCEHLCIEGRCCYGVNDCREPPPDGMTCDDYVSCHVLYGTASFKGTSEEPKTTEPETQERENQRNEEPVTTTHHPDATTIYEACEGDKTPPAKDGELTLCEQLCIRGRCCYDVNDCREPPPDGMTCDDYVSCRVLYGTSKFGGDTDAVALSAPPAADLGDSSGSDSSVSVLASTITSICETDENRDLCKTLCDAGDCCSSNSCKEEDNVNCSDFESCKVLSAPQGGAVPANKDTWEDVRAACQGVPSSSLCTNICRPAKCCFASQRCSIEKDFDCEIYQHCSPIFDNMNRNLLMEQGNRDLKSDNLKDILTEICLDEKEENMAACKNLCKRGDCCFATGDCAKPDEVKCSDYTACGVVYDTTDDDDAAVKEELIEEAEEDFAEEEKIDEEEGIDNQVTAEHISNACGSHVMGMAAAQGQMTPCQTYCEPGMCCFAENLACKDDLDCEIYLPCSKLFERRKRRGDFNNITDIQNSSDEDELDSGGADEEEITKVSEVGEAAYFEPVAISSEESATSTMHIDGEEEQEEEHEKQEAAEEDPDKIQRMKIEEVCKNSKTRSHCVEKCAEASCCYTTVTSERCHWTAPDVDCDLYKACAKIYGKEEIEEGGDAGSRR